MVYNKLILVLLIALSLTACARTQLAISYLSFAGQEIKVEKALTDQEKVNGLSGRESLCPNCGMLFVFNPPKKTGFVMREMKFPLDMVGIRDEKVVAIDENCQPEEGASLTLYQDKEVVDYVLELNAGTVQRLKIKIGDEVALLDK